MWKCKRLDIHSKNKSHYPHKKNINIKKLINKIKIKVAFTQADTSTYVTFDFVV